MCIVTFRGIFFKKIKVHYIHLLNPSIQKLLVVKSKKSMDEGILKSDGNAIAGDLENSIVHQKDNSINNHFHSYRGGHPYYKNHGCFVCFAVVLFVIIIVGAAVILFAVALDDSDSSSSRSYHSKKYSSDASDDAGGIFVGFILFILFFGFILFIVWVPYYNEGYYYYYGDGRYCYNPTAPGGYYYYPSCSNHGTEYSKSCEECTVKKTVNKYSSNRSITHGTFVYGFLILFLVIIVIGGGVAIYFVITERDSDDAAAVIAVVALIASAVAVLMALFSFCWLPKEPTYSATGSSSSGGVKSRAAPKKKSQRSSTKKVTLVL